MLRGCFQLSQASFNIVECSDECFPHSTTRIEIFLRVLHVLTRAFAIKVHFSPYLALFSRNCAQHIWFDNVRI